jgi:MSHA biogenesis protein MshK
VYKLFLAALIMTCSLLSQAKNLDPTKPLSVSSSVGVEEVKKGLTLETIIHGSKNKSAIISGKLMKVGDYIGDHKLITVNSSNVILLADDERIKLSMFSNVVTK